MNQIALSVSDFEELIETNSYYLDKTQFIQEFMNSNDMFSLITRPRRFGKTLNISMLKYFLDITQTSDRLFENL